MAKSAILAQSLSGENQGQNADEERKNDLED